jgi:protein lifeguard
VIDVGNPKAHAHAVKKPKPENGIESLSAPTDHEETYSELRERQLRHGFIKKVYGILMIQLLVTFGIVAIFVFVNVVKNFVQQNAFMVYIAIAVLFATMIALVCFPKVARTSPGNYIALSIFTLAEAYFIGTFASYFNATVVLLAVGGVIVLTLGLTLFACQTRWDFTYLSGGLLGFIIILIIFGIFAGIFQNQILSIVYASIGMLVFSAFLIYDTQLIIGGKHRHISYKTDDYIFAALSLYLDIVNLFMFLLSLIGLGGGGR